MARTKEADNARKKAVRERQAAEKAAAEAKRAVKRERVRATRTRAALAASKEVRFPMFRNPNSCHRQLLTRPDRLPSWQKTVGGSTLRIS